MRSKSCLMRILYKTQKTSGEVLVSDELMVSWTSKLWNHPERVSQSLDDLVTSVNQWSFLLRWWVSVSQKNTVDIGYSRLCLEIASASTLEICFHGRYWRGGSAAGPHGRVPLVLSEPLHHSALLPLCIAPMHVKVRPPNTSRIFPSRWGSWKKTWDVSICLPEVWCLILFPHKWAVTSGCLAENSIRHHFRPFSQ